MGKYYIYIYKDPRNNKPFYIGKGSNSRVWEHLKETKENTDNIFKYRKIQKIRKEKLEPIIKFYKKNIIDENEAYKLETKLIKKYGRKGIDPGGILTNRTTDSYPPHNGFSKINLEKLRKRMIGNQLAKGNHFKRPKEFGEKVKKFHLGKKRSKITCQNISKARKGKGLGKTNAMNKIENRLKVAQSKVGRHIIIFSDGSRHLSPRIL